MIYATSDKVLGQFRSLLGYDMRRDLDISVPPPPRDVTERRRRSPIFELRLGDFSVEQAAYHMLTARRTAAEGVGLFVTPNIQHVALMQRDPAFKAAMRGAQIVVADGFPVYRYAQLRKQGLPGRVTGREVVACMLATPERLHGHRLFCIVDSDETASAIRTWAAGHGLADVLETVVPPFGFDRDSTYTSDLLDRIDTFGTTLLFVGLGAPRSETFVHRHRGRLPACWALCIGQSFKIALGVTAQPPALAVRYDLEWLWRIVLEPRRMLRRYGTSSVAFLFAVITDLRRTRRMRARGTKP